MLLLKFLSINATAAFYMLISTMIRDGGISTGLSVIILAVSNVLHIGPVEQKTSVSFLGKFLLYWFPTHYNSGEIITGKMVDKISFDMFLG